MAKESGTDDSAPDSRPISVAELLARSQGTGATGAEQKSQGRGRRRVGRDGSVSVSELTGEIPRIADPADTPGTGAGPTSNRPAPTTGATPTRPTGTSPAAPGTPPAPASRQAPPPAPAAPGTGGGAPAHPAGPASAPRRPAPAGPGSGTFPTSPPSGSFGAAGPRSAPFPRSENPVARRTPGDRAVGDTTGSGTRTGLGRSTASGMPGFDRPPGTRDFNAGDVANRLGAPAGAGRGSQPPATSDPADTASANAVTGIIPVVGDGDPDLVVVETDDVEGADLRTPPTAPSSTTRGSGFAEVMDDDFEAYRSFADVEKDADEQPKPKRRRWFGRKKKDRASGAAVAGAAGAAGVGAAAAAATSRATKAKRDADAPADTARTDAGTARTGADAGAADTRTGTSPAEAARDAVTEVTVDEKRTGLTGRGVEVTDTAATVSASATDSTTAPDSTIGDDPAVGDATGTRPRSDDTRGAADRAPVAFGESTLGNLVSPARADDGAAWGRPADRETVGSDPAGPATARAATPDTTVTDTPTTDAADDAPGADLTKADATRADRKADRKATRKADRKRGDTDTDTDDTSSRRRFSDSPVMAWLSVFAQVVVGLAVGVGLFWGFIELWKWNVYFALVLAVVVIFGIVTLTHLVRRNRDLPTTLLALAVGLVVTLGPLVVLLSA